MTADLGAARALARRGKVILALGLLGVAAQMVLALQFTPVEARQGLAQKIFYIHVPSATVLLWIAMPFAGLMSVLYLWLREPRFDRLAAVTAEVGTIFCLVVLVTGPIWAKPIWGAWWTWDGRLTLTLFLFFLLLGYHTLRAAVRDPVERGRFSAVLSVMGVILVPFIHLSVYLWRGLHPQPIVLKPSAPSLPPEMLRTLLVGFAVFIVMFVGMVTLRYGIQLARDVKEAADAA
ncbi:MAG TPA: cytochrome c biogenesis protein CcsA [Gemmatimonadales bacterium]|nr:cytochrome c biogenesis protein CcsA [Gemmatimonadales bacterium]